MGKNCEQINAHRETSFFVRERGRRERERDTRAPEVLRACAMCSSAVIYVHASTPYFIQARIMRRNLIRRARASFAGIVCIDRARRTPRVL